VVEIVDVVILSINAVLSEVTAPGLIRTDLIVDGYEVGYVLIFSNGETIKKRSYFTGNIPRSFDGAHKAVCSLWEVKM
jgi:hypothetical protein